MKRIVLHLFAVASAACGPGVTEIDTSDVSAPPDVATTAPDGGQPADAGEPSDAAWTDAATDGGEEADADLPDPDPTPQPVAPCDGADCWDATLGGPPCAVATHDEDFASGNYNVHRYGSFLWDGTTTRVTVSRTAGTWEPALVLLDADGRVLFDGQVGLNGEGVTTTVHAPHDVTVTSTDPTGLTIHVTSAATLASNFVERVPLDARYTISLNSDCGGEREACVFNGNTAAEPACGWMHYVARRVVPRLPGDRAARLHTASVVAWWALKEGVMFLPNPIVYSNCNFPSGDARIGPLESCVDNRAWQVGLSAVQVPYHTDAAVEGRAATLYPELTVAQVLRLTAIEAQLDATSVDAVVNSTGTLRRSWLLRNSAIGFVTEAPVVEGECIDDSRAWCYGTGWSASANFAPNRTGALRAIDDVRAFLDRRAP